KPPMDLTPLPLPGKPHTSELLPHGVAPAWFHGFVSRREAEQRLQEGPQGVFLVRFSESGVGFVLSYRWNSARWGSGGFSWPR
uniref:SH2 domain-containing protein n=1 Tax=Ornithorhynchus anatinus TaxID=9258 RepID=A0A6I8P8Z0_ORNAN